MSRIGALAVLHLAAVPAAVPDAGDRLAPAGPLTLTCEGVATNPVGDPTRSSSHARRKSGSAIPKTARSHEAKADDDGDTADGGDATAPRASAGRPARGATVAFVFEFAGDHGRVLYPAAIIPVIHSGSDRDGWWPVRDLAASDEAFSGRILLNFINHARFTIDRRTGVFNLAGLQANVTGRCAKADRGPRLF